MPAPSPLKAAAAAKGLTLIEVADRIGYSANTVGNVSKGAATPWPEIRRRLEVLFGFDPYADERFAGSAALAPLVEEAAHG